MDTPCCGIVLGGTMEQYTIRNIPESRVEVNRFYSSNSAIRATHIKPDKKAA